MHAATASETLPPLAALRFGRRLPAARRWIVGWGLVRLLDDGIALAPALQGRHNLRLRYPFGPLETALLLVAFPLWHADAVARLALRVAVPVFALTWGLLVGFRSEER